MIKKLFCSLLLLLLSTAAGAFGLGGIQVESALNEPLSARVELISVRPDEIDNIKVRLAGPDEFAQLGISRPFFLSKLRFKLVAPEGGAPYIRISSRESVREPYLSFLVSVSWSRGSMLREFTILLDPPSYTPPSVAATQASMRDEARPLQPAQTPALDVEPRVRTYGPIERTDTLWVIAGKVQPDRSISRNQIMMALLKANPHAFQGGNINQLRRGAELTIPTREQMTSISRSQATAEVKQQMAEWRQGRAGKQIPKSSPSEIAQTSQAAQVPPTEPKPEPQVTDAGKADQVDKSTKKQLRVLDAEGNWVVAQEGDKEYPVREADKIREAIRDSEQELVAVQAINKDIVELRAALESKVAALKKALEEKDAQLESLRKQIERAEEKASAVVPAAGDAPPDGRQGVQAVNDSESGPVVAGSVSTDSQMPSSTGISRYWKNEYLVPVMGGVIVLLVLMLIFSTRRKSQVQAAPAPELFQVDSQQTERSPSYGHAPASFAVDDTPGRVAVIEQATTEPSQGVQSVSREPQSRPVSSDIPSVLTEVDIYLAYRRYSQAENLVEEAMRAHPDSSELQAKLLEIYAFRRDASAFGRYLEQVQPMLMTQSPELWQRVVEMGRELVPDHPAFADPGVADGSEAEVPPSEGISATEALSASSDDESIEDIFDIDLEAPESDAGSDEAISIGDLIPDDELIQSSDDSDRLPDPHEVPSIEIDLGEEDLDLDFDEDGEESSKRDR